MVLYAASPIIPGVVHACRESRALNLYERFILEPATTASYAWVNYDVDTIEIGENEHYIRFKHCGHKIRRLKFKGNIDCEVWTMETSYDLRYFSNLIECFVVTSDNFIDWGGDDGCYRPLCDTKSLFIIKEQTGETKCCAELDLAWEEEQRS